MKKVKEEYRIKYHKQKEDGYWLYGQVAYIQILVHPDREKNSHKQAEREFLEKNENCYVDEIALC